MTTPHPQVVRLARELCDSRYGAGHYDKPRTHRRYWCRKAAAWLANCEAMPTVKTLMRACGWQV